MCTRVYREIRRLGCHASLLTMQETGLPTDPCACHSVSELLLLLNWAQRGFHVMDVEQHRSRGDRASSAMRAPERLRDSERDSEREREPDSD